MGGVCEVEEAPDCTEKMPLELDGKELPPNTLDSDDELVPVEVVFQPANADFVLLPLDSAAGGVVLALVPNEEVEPNTEAPPKGLGFEVRLPKADFTGCVEDVGALSEDVAELPNADAGGGAAGAVAWSPFGVSTEEAGAT